MTRKEILDCSKSYLDGFEINDREKMIYKLGCIDGLISADADPDTTIFWHNFEDIPNDEIKLRVLCIDNLGFIWVLNLEETFGKEYRKEINTTNIWKNFVDDNYLLYWSYLEDLLPQSFRKPTVK